MGMRADANGFLWQTEVKVGKTAANSAKGKGSKKREPVQAKYKKIVPMPDGYTPPNVFKSFLHLPCIGFDLETFDPLLKSQGPGTLRGDAHIVGAAIGYGEGEQVYYPLRHKSGQNVDVDAFIAWLREMAPQYRGEVLGANILYDLDHCASEGIYFSQAKVRDVQWAEALLDEEAMSYSLGTLAKKYLGTGKVTDELSELYGSDYITMMPDLHAGHVARYASGDVRLPFAIHAKQLTQLQEQGLIELYDMECQLAHLLLQMRRIGVRIDLGCAESSYAELMQKAEDAGKQLKQACGMNVDIWAADSVAAAFDKLGIAYPRTAPSKARPDGAPSFTNKWLEAHKHPFTSTLNEARKYQKVCGTFIKGYILDNNVKGRIHCSFHPLRGDENGTVSGRFSSSGPNLQNIPARDPVLGPLMRSMFVPEEGMDWGCADWSQIEYRFLVHYAAACKVAGYEKAWEMYNSDASTDFHTLAAKISGVERKKAKNINFGVVYGMGVKTMAAQLGVGMDEASAVLDTFHTNMPFLKGMYDTAAGRASHQGFIKTVLGRRRRFNGFEFKAPGEHKWTMQSAIDPQGQYAFLKGMKYDDVEALKAGYGEDSMREKVVGIQVRRAFTYRALNSLLQGSSADLMKKSMVMCYEQGVFNTLVPHLTVHDEFDVSIPRSKEGTEAFEELKRIMTTALTLNVPITVSANTGANWDDAK